MGLTFRESVAEVQLGLISSDQLADIATAGLIEGYESPALVALAAQLGEPYDPVSVELLWTEMLEELVLTPADRRIAAETLVRAYARLVAIGELPPQLGASKIVGVHDLATDGTCCRDVVGDCMGISAVVGLFYSGDERGYSTSQDARLVDEAILTECRRLADVAGV